ncbi:Crp/Fnr family transcriptional regulator [Pseudomonas citronellolis]|uniref:Crp/Fnr family transcriptional regulator n=1 Tax=Pseudomonas citronellolis TaxID=53408 RepID=UPI0023E3F5FD|nr:Crp/Fnr family transcriptional regulator [Pseudomonas citronellolis]MDF3936606.1 Crp/Fnr family transcriptional regulator [Pseudomonas citronellolis]
MIFPPLLSESHLAMLMASRWFGGLPAPTRDDLLARASVRALATGKLLFRCGEPPDGLYIVLQGVIRLSNTTRDGQEAVLNFYEPGNWLGEVSQLDRSVRLHDAYAQVPSQVLHISPLALGELCDRHPALVRMLLELEVSRLRAMLVAFSAFSTQSLEQRLAGRLLGLSESFGVTGEKGLSLDLRLSQEAMAQLIGATRQRVNQVLNRWEAEGLVEHAYGRISILDRARLEALAGGEG